MKVAIGLISSVLMALSFQTFAEKVVITGEPVVLQQQDGVYVLPETYTSTGSYYYVSMDGTKSVCYLEKQPTLSSLTLKPVNVKVKGGQTVEWNCYPLDEGYFEVRP